MNISLQVDWKWIGRIALIILVLHLPSCIFDTDEEGTPATYAPTEKCAWAWQNPQPTGNHLRNITFTDSDTWTAVGDNGTIIRTTDGGATWVCQASGTENWLYDVAFTDTHTGTAVGSFGSIIQTTDGGETWVALDLTSTDHDISPRGWFTGISFTDADTGYVVSAYGGIYGTTDGGITWKDHASAGYGFWDVSHTDVNTGAAVGMGGSIVWTRDGWTKWMPRA